MAGAIHREGGEAVTPAEVAGLAAQRLRDKGWLQGTRGACDGPVCLLGALAVACGGHPNGGLNDAAELVWRTLQGVVGTEYLVHWNDTPGRTADEVIAALEVAGMRLASRAPTVRP